MEEKIQGLPTALMIPATMYDLVVIHENIRIDIPISGNYKELYPDFKTDNDDFNCVGTLGDDDEVVIDMYTITNVLFAEVKYPKLDSDSFFSISALVLNKEEHTLTLIGNVMKFVTEEGE